MSKKLVSVVIPSYNHAGYIEESIASVFEQASSEVTLQVIIVDDCSQDNSVEVIQSLKSKYDFEFYNNDENVGVNKTIENGLLHAKGDYISFLASDDFFLEGKLRKQIEYFLLNDVDVVYGKGKVFEGSGEYLAEQDLSAFAKAIQKGPQSALKFVATDDTSGPLLQSALFKREIAYELCDLRSQFRSDDWVVLLYMLKNKKVGYLDECVLGYRLHENNTHKNYWMMFLFRMEVIIKFIPTIDESLMPKALSNLFVSQGVALFRNNNKKFALSFILSSFVFCFPLSKIRKAIRRLFS